MPCLHHTGVPALSGRIVSGGVRIAADTSQVHVLRDVHHLSVCSAVRRPAHGVPTAGRQRRESLSWRLHSRCYLRLSAPGGR